MSSTTVVAAPSRVSVRAKKRITEICFLESMKLASKAGNRQNHAGCEILPLHTPDYVAYRHSPEALQVEQMARDRLAANVPAETLFDTAIRPCQSLVLTQVLVP